MQKINERESKAEFGAHLCIDVEDAVSTLLVKQCMFCSVEYAFCVIIRICICCLQPEITSC